MAKAPNGGGELAHMGPIEMEVRPSIVWKDSTRDVEVEEIRGYGNCAQEFDGGESHETEVSVHGKG